MSFLLEQVLHVIGVTVTCTRAKSFVLLYFKLVLSSLCCVFIFPFKLIFIFACFVSMPQAGGLSLDGRSRVMQRVPQSMKDTTPFFAGSALDVLELKSYYDADAEETTTSPSNHIQKYVWESAEGWRGKAV